ncbi:MAG: 5-(carboxyamino)imidazole ribonucleotide mutase [Candidatus Cryptobacteroides sp.]|nr:5-(carboxyamino)imidazole ribonucleotide mutase [Bacteroidales bacterium]
MKPGIVSVIMGSKSDWDVMSAACETLDSFGVSYEKKVISAHRTPEFFCDYISSAAERGVKVVIAGAGGAAHLPGMAAAMTTLPVIGVPIKSALSGLDSLLSIVQMPSGIPVATMAIGGAKNAALYAVSILALQDEALAEQLRAFRKEQAEKVLQTEL